MPVLLSYNYQVSFISYDSSIANSYLRLTLGVIRQVCFSNVAAWCICYTVAILGEPSGERNLKKAWVTLQKYTEVGESISDSKCQLKRKTRYSQNKNVVLVNYICYIFYSFVIFCHIVLIQWETPFRPRSLKF